MALYKCELNWTLVDPMHYPANEIRAAPMQRHHFINDLTWRTLSKNGLPSMKEPHGNKLPAPMVSPLFHGAMVTDALPGTSQLLTLWSPLTWAYHMLVQPKQPKRRLNAKKRSTLKSPAVIISFPLPLRHSVLLIRSVLTSFPFGAIAFHPALMTQERHFYFFNAFLLRSSVLMLSASPIIFVLQYCCGSAT